MVSFILNKVNIYSIVFYINSYIGILGKVKKLAINIKNNQKLYPQWILALKEAKKQGLLARNCNITKIPLGKL